MVLSNEELLRLEILDVKIALAKAKVDLQRAQLTSMAKDAEVLKLRGDIQKLAVKEAELAAEGAAEDRRKATKSIAAEKGIDGAWWFDPLTGEIILPEPGRAEADNSP
jgi:hypothetical protein